MKETLFETMAKDAENCWHVVEHRRVMVHPRDPLTFIFVCLRCGITATENQVRSVAAGQKAVARQKVPQEEAA